MRIPLAAIAVLAALSPAMGHDWHALGIADGSADQNWLKGLKNKSGGSCCNGDDGSPAEVEWDVHTDTYRVKIEGEWWPVPPAVVLETPNRMGYAMVWWYASTGIGGKFVPIIRCFLRGVQG